MIIHKKSGQKCLPAYWLIIFCWLFLVVETVADNPSNKADWGANLNHLFDLRAMFRSPLSNYYFITDRSTQRSRWFSTMKTIQGIQPLKYITDDQILLIKHNGRSGYLALSKTHTSNKDSTGLLKPNTSADLRRNKNKPEVLPGTPTSNSSNRKRSHSSHATTRNVSATSLPAGDDAGFIRNRISHSSRAPGIKDTPSNQKTQQEVNSLLPSPDSETQSDDQKRRLGILKQPRPLNYIEVILPEE